MKSGLFLASIMLVLSPLSVSLGSRRAIISSDTETSLIDSLSNASINTAGLGQNAATSISTIASHLEQIKHMNTTGPNSVQSALSMIEKDFHSGSNILDVAHAITLPGFLPADVVSFLNGYRNSHLNSVHNQNPIPSQDIYPFKAAGDAPYSISEDKLRAAIQIPDIFSYGKNGKTPVILVPGTGVPAGLTYYYSFSKLGNDIPVDPVWVNVPHASLSDAQVNAEYIAFAINYISDLCAGQDVAVISWSQGGLNTQWALKYWPSVRAVVKDFIAISPDFHGTIIATSLCPATTFVACTPSVWQQRWEAEFIKTLRDDDGNSAYVPTTTVYSSTDEIVEPMSGMNASAILADVRRIGVTNAHLQTVCRGKPAGGFYTHEGVLYNPLAWALAIDAITHEGPASLSRLDLNEVCQQELSPTLDLEDVLGTEGLNLVAVAEILTYRPQPASEPPVKQYATRGS